MKKLFISLVCLLVATTGIVGCSPSPDGGNGNDNTPTPPVVSYVSVSGQKTEFEIGENFSQNDLSVTAHYTDGTTKTLDSSKYTLTCDGFDSSVPGAFNAKVSLNGSALFTTFTVTIKQAPVNPEPDTVDGELTLDTLAIKSGSLTKVYDALKSTSDRTLALYEKPITDGTVTASIMPGKDAAAAGIVFKASVSQDGNYDEPGVSYYYFHLSGTQARFVRVENGISYLVKASLTKGINCRREQRFKVVIDGNNYKGYINGICYLNYTDSNPLEGNEVGLRADASEVCFYNSEVTAKKEIETADMVMFGHSHTDCWDLAESQLSSKGKLVNVGIGGTIIPQWMSRIDDLTAYNAKKFVCWLGSNDIGAGIDNSVTMDRMNVLFKEIATAVPDAEIYLFTEFYQLESNRTTEAYRSRIRDLNQRYKTEFTGINVVDIFDVVLTPDGMVDNSLFRDSYHLKSDCYGDVAQRLLAAMDNPVKVNSATGAEKKEFVVSEGNNSSWSISKGLNGLYISSNHEHQMITLANTEFDGGTVEFKLTIPTNTFKKNNVSGVVFGANDYYIGHATGTYYCVGQSKWGDLVGFYKNHSDFEWIHENKIPQGNLTIGTEYKIKVVWDKENNAIHYFLNDVYRMSTRAATALYGNKIGFYADSVGVTFKDVRISDELELDGVDVFYTRGLNDAWTITESAGKTSYKANGGKILTFNKSFGNADKWLIEYDFIAHDNNFVDKMASGVLIGASSPVVDQRDTYVVVGRSAYNGEINAYSWENGFRRWEDSSKIFNVFTQLNKSYHVKLVWNKKQGTIDYYLGNTLRATQKLSVKLYGEYFGLVSDSSVTFSNLSITPVQ